MAKKGLTRNDDFMDPEANSGVGKAIRKSKAFKDVMKKIREGLSKAVRKIFEAIGKLISSTLPYSLIVIAIIIVILLFVAFIQAFLNVPGDMQARLKAFFEKAFEGWHFRTGAEVKLDENYEDIIGVINYLENMEYDVIGYGFVKPDLKAEKRYTVDELVGLGYAYNTYEYMIEQGFSYGNTDNLYHLFNMQTGEIFDGTYYNSLGIAINNYTNDRETNGETYTDIYGMVRSTEEYNENGKGKLVRLTNETEVDKVKKIARTNYGLIRTYLLSDYRIYSIRNYDQTIMSKVYEAMDAVFGGNQDAWSKGLLMLYNSTNALATSNWDFGDRLIGDAAHITRETLELKDGYMNNPMTYKIEGWAPRYGLSLEFLLSIHLGTMAPDLVYAMLQNFDTEVQVYLNDSGHATVSSTYIELDRDKNVSNKEVTLGLIKATLEETDHPLIAKNIQIGDNGALQFLGTVTLTRDAVGDLFRSDIGLSSPWNCTGEATSYVVIDEASTGGQKYIEFPGFLDYLRDIGEDIEYGEASDDMDLLQVFYGYNDSDLAEIDYDKRLDAYNGEYVKFNRSTALTSYKFEHNLRMDDDVDFNTAYDEQLAKRSNSTNYLIDHLGLPTRVNLDNTTVVDWDREDFTTKESIQYNKIYEITENKKSKDWSIFLDKNGNVINEEAFLENGETSNESDVGYRSYIYSVYEIGMIDASGNRIIYGENNPGEETEAQSRVLINSFAYTEMDTSELEPGEEIDHSKDINHTVYIYYNPEKEFHYEIEDVPEKTSKIRWVERSSASGDKIDAMFYLAVQGQLNGDESFYSNHPVLRITENSSNDSIVGTAFALDGAYQNDEGNSWPGCKIFGYTGEGSWEAEVVNVKLSDIVSALEGGSSSLLQGKVLKDVLCINVAVRDKTIEEMIQSGLLNEDGTLKDGHGNCSGQCMSDDDFKPCRACVQYVKKVITGLHEISDQDYKFYTPYIARVVGSWFRNVYFVIPENADMAITNYKNSHTEYNDKEAYGSSVHFVKVDKEYLADSGEYWTAYEMKEDDSNEYQLFFLNPDGTTSDIKMEDFLEEKGYRSQKEAEDAGWAFVKKAKLMSLEETIAESTAIKSYYGTTTDDEGNKIDKDPEDGKLILWSAYSFDTSGNQKDRERALYNEDDGDNNEVQAVYDIIYHIDKGEEGIDNTGEEDTESADAGIDLTRANDPNEPTGYFYDIAHTNNVTQEEDAQRAETNPLVKYLFKYRQFYIYDGTEKTALAIEHDKYRVLHGYQKYIKDGFDPTEEFYASKKLVKEQYKEIEKIGYNGISEDGEFYHYIGLLSCSEDDLTVKGLLERYYGYGWEVAVTDLLNHFGRSAIRDSYNWASLHVDQEELACQWLDWQLDMFYMDKYGVDLYQYYNTTPDEVASFCPTITDLDNGTSYTNDKLLLLKVDPRDPDLVGKVSIEKSSLNSFAILENVGTLDAEYQYRDFKELIVELNYFDKEDLSEKIPEIFTWVLPDISPAGWPVLPFDKQNVDYGTLIHSNKTYLGLSDYTGIPLGLGNLVQAKVDSLDGFLFIGDSRVNVQTSEIEKLGEGVKAIGVGASYPSMWVNVTDPSSSGIEDMPEGDHTHRVELPDASQVKGVYMMHGVNGPTQISDMKTVLENLHVRYPNVPFFMASAIHVGVVKAGFWYEPPEHNRLIDLFNQAMEDYCNANDWIEYVDIQDGLYDANGYLKHEYAHDYVHIYPGQSPEGTQIYINNIKESVLGSNASSSSSTSSTSSSSIAEDKIYWIGDSWIAGLAAANIPGKSQAGTITNSTCTSGYFFCKSGENASWVIGNYGSMNIPNDASCVVIEFGLNNPEGDGDTQQLIEKIHGDHPDLQIFVLKTSHLDMTKYSGTVTNERVDGYNQRMEAWCNTKDYVTFLPNVVNRINENNGEGPLIASMTNDGVHLSDYNIYYSDIISGIGSGGGSGSSANNTAAYFSGYEKDQKVTSPITGKVIEYGIHTRKNVYTLEDEEVGYIIIEAMSDNYFTPDMIPADVEYESNIDEEFDHKSDYDTADEALNLFYKEYEKVCAGYRVMIDGFDVDLTIEGGEYEQNDVAVLYNTKEQAKREAMEQAKDDAPFMLNLTGLSELPSFEDGYRLENEDSLQAIFIKEGKYIGTTVEPTGELYDEETEDVEDPDSPAEPAVPDNPDEEENEESGEVDNKDWGNFDYSNYKGPTDYMRIIMKDLDYSLVENVEKYFDIPELGEVESSSSSGFVGDMEILFFTVFEGGPWETWPADSWFRTVSGGEGSLTCVTNLKPSDVNFEVGIIQWTSNSSLTNIQQFCRVAAERNPSLFGRLSKYQDMDSTTLRIRSNKDALLQDMLDISHEDWDALAEFEISYAMEGYLQPVLDRYPWLAERRGVVQGSVMSIQVLHGYLGDNAAGTLLESMSDKEIIEKCRQAMASFTGSSGENFSDRANKQAAFANDVVDGKISDAQITQFIKTGTY